MKSNTSPETKTLQSALKLAKDGSSEKAQALIEKMDKESLFTQDLRTLALVHSYSGLEHEAVQVWDLICSRDDVRIGDCFMLASTQISLGNSDQAISNLEREIAASDRAGDDAYLSVSAINLAFLLSNKGRRSEALAVLERLGDQDGTYIHGVGQMTKRDLLARLNSAK